MSNLIIGQRQLTIEDVIDASYNKFSIVIDNDTLKAVLISLYY